ncbi:hypothetical protein PoB_001416700 [Plakobranchus ocellatus]|uniref:Uncharacterized protein n=1 Tax=Plakobranchus ocellatus TaxID=259542 RepID=A0AAV3YXF2_9GAST|nr:hypothetical protein PoB_001416700 [Plakobranchus ocellatus]
MDIISIEQPNVAARCLPVSQCWLTSLAHTGGSTTSDQSFMQHLPHTPPAAIDRGGPALSSHTLPADRRLKRVEQDDEGFHPKVEGVSENMRQWVREMSHNRLPTGEGGTT